MELKNCGGNEAKQFWKREHECAEGTMCKEENFKLVDLQLVFHHLQGEKSPNSPWLSEERENERRGRKNKD